MIAPANTNPFIPCFIRYNMRDCEVTLDLCFNLDLINQMIILCYATKSSMSDVCIYSTGAMAASCLTRYARDKGMGYVWNRCGWYPGTLAGAYVHFIAPVCVRYAMSVDFISMYLSLRISSNISPESIDILEKDGSGSRFHLIAESRSSSSGG